MSASCRRLQLQLVGRRATCRSSPRNSATVCSRSPIVFIGEAQELVVTTKGSIGIVTRVELWNWHTFNWTLALDRPMPARRLMYYTMNDERLPMPPVLTNRVRVTVEQWLAPRDVIINIALIRSYLADARSKLYVLCLKIAARCRFLARARFSTRQWATRCASGACVSSHARLTRTTSRLIAP
jgi:hypothetical protein